MCNQCQNNFLIEIVETQSEQNALEMFKEANKNYLLPSSSEVIDEGELVGYVTYLEHIEGIEEQLLYEISHKVRPLNKIYVYTSNLLKQYNKMVVVCVANRKGFACTSLNYIPGRRF